MAMCPWLCAYGAWPARRRSSDRRLEKERVPVLDWDSRASMPSLTVSSCVHGARFLLTTQTKNLTFIISQPVEVGLRDKILCHSAICFVLSIFIMIYIKKEGAGGLIWSTIVDNYIERDHTQI